MTEVTHIIMAMSMTVTVHNSHPTQGCNTMGEGSCGNICYVVTYVTTGPFCVIVLSGLDGVACVQNEDALGPEPFIRCQL